MSKHWRPGGPAVPLRPRRRPVNWARLESYWTDEVRSRPLPKGGHAGLILVAAACLGVAIGAYQAFGPREIVGAEAADWARQAPVTVLPDHVPDPADAEWEARSSPSSVIASPARRPGEAIQTGLPRASGARNDAVRASFAFCHTGGGDNCVVDGDTFYIGGAKVRIVGIDAPETHPPRCAREAELGAAATRQLRALLNSGAVTMTNIDRNRDKYGRLLRNVQVDGADVGQALIAAGLAREYGRGRRGWC